MTLPAPGTDPSLRVRPLVRTFFRWLARRRIGRALDGVHVAGMEATRALVSTRPVLLAVTHVSRWDPLVLLVLDEALGCDGRALMDAANLDRLPFFAWIGAIPIDRSGGARARRGLRMAASFLDRPLRAVWVFPQGRQRATHLRPFQLERGVALLAALSGAVVVPVGLSYAFRERDGPAVLVTFGTPIRAAGFTLPLLESALASAVQRGDAFADAGAGAHTPLVAAAGGGEGWYTRALAWIARRIG